MFNIHNLQYSEMFFNIITTDAIAITSAQKISNQQKISTMNVVHMSL